MKHKAKYSVLKLYYYFIGLSVCLVFMIECFKNQSYIIDYFYVDKLYPTLSYMYLILFSWIPFSVGDIVYFLIIMAYSLFVLRLIQSIFKRNWSELKLKMLQIISLTLLLYNLFYVNWGLNYFRTNLPQSYNLDVAIINKQDHLEVLDKYIIIANDLRAQINIDSLNKIGVKRDLEELVRKDTIFESFLIKSQIHIKQPISSKAISYFTVSGYFNPFTLESHINEEIPLPGYPFTVVHELAHQQGVGVEDECNFIAFIQLRDSKDLWYRYSAYYSAIQYLLQPLYGDEKLVKKYKDMLSPEVLSDLRAEREFWMSYRGWIDKISGAFYDNYLKHNNQPEGIERYNMMSKLVVAWEKKQQK